jgi:hypothetical protein
MEQIRTHQGAQPSPTNLVLEELLVYVAEGLNRCAVFEELCRDMCRIVFATTRREHKSDTFRFTPP